MRIPGRIQKDYPTDGSPGPAVFELDRGDNLGTIATLEQYIEVRRDVHMLFPSQKSDRMTGKVINDVVQRLASRAEIRPSSFRRAW